MRAHLLLGAALVAVVSGCGGGNASRASERPQLGFVFKSTTGDGYIDQTLRIRNDGDASLAPTLEITPLDESGERVPGVTARTAGGSERGRVVIPAGGEVLDVVRFDGPAAAKLVRDVKVRVAASEEVSTPSWDGEPVTGERLDDEGNVVEFGLPFSSVRITNPNRKGTTVRAVLVEYDQDVADDERQQFVRVTTVADEVQVDGQSEATVGVPPDVPDEIGASVLVFPVR